MLPVGEKQILTSGSSLQAFLCFFWPLKLMLSHNLGWAVIRDFFLPSFMVGNRLCMLAQSTGVDCHFLLQGIFPTQRLNSHLLHWQTGSLPRSQLLAHKLIIFKSSLLNHKGIIKSLQCIFSLWCVWLHCNFKN